MRARGQSGFTMIEVLITIAILLLGLLGLAGLQAQIAVAELEAFQRAQALVIVQDMVDRMSANKADLRANPANYVLDDIGASATVDDCSGMGGYRLDLCEFNNVLVGAAERDPGAGTNVGAMIGARGCITNPSADTWVVTVAWQGMAPTAKPEEACGAGAYGANDAFRRTVSLVVRRATLS